MIKKSILLNLIIFSIFITGCTKVIYKEKLVCYKPKEYSIETRKEVYTELIKLIHKKQITMNSPIITQIVDYNRIYDKLKYCHK